MTAAMTLGAGAPSTAPSVDVSVSTGTPSVVVPSTAIGINASTYDGDLLAPQLPKLLRNIGISVIRFPGGTESDRYDWMTNTDVITNQKEAVDFNQFMKLVNKVHAQAMITVDYGTGKMIGASSGQSGAQIAADWVYYANVLHHYHIKYWEIGNEVYGNGTYGADWEPDDHCDTAAGTPVNVANEPSQTYGCGPSTYASNVQRYISAMKKVDPNITIGVVLTADGAPNNWPNGITNAESPESWDQTVLSALGSEIGFADVHWYPQNPSNVSPPGPSDVGLLASTDQIPTAVQTLRSDFAKWGGDANLPLMITETNSVSSNPGKQTLSVVNALFLDQDYLTWLENGVANVDWWQIHNGIDTTGDNGATNEDGQAISGTTDYGDYGILSNGSCGVTPSGSTVCEPPAETPFSSYYGLELLSRFISPGDTMMPVSSNQSLVKAFAVQTRGGNLKVLMVNDNPTTQYALNVSAPGYSAQSVGPVYMYGPASTAMQVLHGRNALSAETALPAYTVITYTLHRQMGN